MKTSLLVSAMLALTLHISAASAAAGSEGDVTSSTGTTTAGSEGDVTSSTGTTTAGQPGTSANASAASPNNDSKEAVVQWFKRYDQIRRDAELSLTEKFQTMSFLDKNCDRKVELRKRDQDLVDRMSAKYAKADQAMKNLTSVPATKDLQDGYTSYFSQVHKIFTRFKKDTGSTDSSCPSSSMRDQRSALQELDAANKKLDAKLRAKYGIAKHKHS